MPSSAACAALELEAIVKMEYSAFGRWWKAVPSNLLDQASWESAASAFPG